MICTSPERAGPVRANGLPVRPWVAPSPLWPRLQGRRTMNAWQLGLVQACTGRSEARRGPESSACVLLHPPMPPEGMGTPPVGLTVRWLGLLAVGRPYGAGRAGPLDCWLWASRARKEHLGVVQAGATTSQQVAAHERGGPTRSGGRAASWVGARFSSAVSARFPRRILAKVFFGAEKKTRAPALGWFPA